MIVLRDTDIDSKGLYEYLTTTNSLAVNSVTALKKKHEHYQCFIVECNEMLVDRLFDDNLWDAGTVVKDFEGSPKRHRICECFPPSG